MEVCDPIFQVIKWIEQGCQEGRTLELKFKGYRALERQGGSARYWETSVRKERAGKKLKNRDCGMMEEIQSFSSIDQYKIEIIL